MFRLAKRFYSQQAGALAKTALYDFHVANGGKMVEYAGYEMPVLYKGQSHVESHNWVRSSAGLFDVSHMLQHKFSGPDALAMLEKVTPADLKGLEPFSSTLSVLLNENGGIVDDTIICKHSEDEFYVVTNAGCREKDLAFFKNAQTDFGSGVNHSIITGGLLALQGPKAAETLQKFTTFDLSQIKFGQSAFVPLEGGNYHVARGGYTGEDGFEVSITDGKVAEQFAYKLVELQDVVKPIGLAARDSLRLEAGMCLYGHELSEDISPVEAALTWVIGKRRRAEPDNGFNGAQIVLDQIAKKTEKLRVGLTVEGPAARDGAEIFLEGDASTPIGVVTSGSMSPTLKKNIAMGYVPRKYSKSGTKLNVMVRGKLRSGEVVKMPFVKTNYYK